MADQFEPFRKTLGAQKVNTFLSKFGLGPDYVPKAPPVYECPQCHGKNGRVREDHPDTDMNEMNLHCPDCGYVGDPPRPVSTGPQPISEADALPRKMGPCSTPMPRTKRPKRRTEDAVEDLVSSLLEDDLLRVCTECAKKHPELIPPGAQISHGLCRRHFIELYGEMGQRMASNKPDSAFPPDLGE